MAGVVNPGGTHPWPVDIHDPGDAGQRFDATALSLVVKDPLGNVVAPPFPVALGDFIHDGLGQYHYDWTVDALATLGTYSAFISATADGGRAFVGTDTVEVLPPSDLSLSGTAIGQYATLTGAKKRMAWTDVDAERDGLMTDMVNQANGDLEAFMRRVAAPIPYLNTSLAAGANPGDTTISVVNAAHAAFGGQLCVGDLAGAHEVLEILSVSSNVVTLTSPVVGTYASGKPVQAVFYFHGQDLRDSTLRLGLAYPWGSAFGSGKYQDRMLTIPVPQGFSSLSLLEFADTGGYTAVAVTDRAFGPDDREPGRPFSQILVASSVYAFPRYGLRNIRAVMAPGWAAVPDELHRIGDELAVARWQDRQSGGTYHTEMGSDSASYIQKTLDSMSYRILCDYRVADLSFA